MAKPLSSQRCSALWHCPALRPNILVPCSLLALDLGLDISGPSVILCDSKSVHCGRDGFRPGELAFKKTKHIMRVLLRTCSTCATWLPVE